MNIKSLILGSAAALVAGGAAQAADLPVAEPVEYVKVCNAYGAGYHFIPGTDTCLKISGYVRAEWRWNDADAREKHLNSIWARGQVSFTAKEETELGTLVGYIQLNSDVGDSTSATKSWLSLGGLYAGLTDSAATIDYSVGMYATAYVFGDLDTGAIGYNMDLGNGVSAHFAIENHTSKSGAGVINGQAMPDMVAALQVAQGWGEAKIAAAVTQIRYTSASVDTDYGWAIGAGVNFNLDMLSAGSTFALTAGYTHGANDYLSLNSAIPDSAINGDLNNAYVIGGALNYAWADNFSTAIDAYWLTVNDENGGTWDGDRWGVGLTAAYTPVKNFTVKAGVGYTDTDWDNPNGVTRVDGESWEGKIRLQRNF